jgi:hypothetical protein
MDEMDGNERMRITSASRESRVGKIGKENKEKKRMQGK